ncbi:MAG: lytic transglycosylase domain-containing protein [Clostridia bacterium]|nr:lytic transglycosylase domain-containing protein [Clostridia bacterium]
MSKGKKRSGKRIFLPLALLFVLAILFVCVLPDALERVNYPVRYAEWIEEFAEDYGLDPALVAAIVYTESGYDVNATSAVGARGLMQVMPSTAEWIHPKLKKPYPFDADVLYTVDGALTYGCWYLDFLSDLFDGDPLSVIAAYHAGQGKVQSWRKDTACAPDGVHLTNIPEGAKATRHYVEKVNKAYEYYTKIYHADAFQ